jgi:predicted DNA-binding protein (UPF0251 family)
MARPQCPRLVRGEPDVVYFKPAGIPLRQLREETLPIDQYEAIRLVDHEGLNHAEAALRMKVSRQTLGRILLAARKKIALFLTQGTALRIEGGPILRHK